MRSGAWICVIKYTTPSNSRAFGRSVFDGCTCAFGRGSLLTQSAGTGIFAQSVGYKNENLKRLICSAFYLRIIPFTESGVLCPLHGPGAGCAKETRAVL